MKKDNRSKLMEETLNAFRQVIFPVWHFTRTQIKKLITTEYGITSAQFHTIRTIAHGNSSASSLAECMHVSRPNISRTVDELVRNGLILRTRDENDRRNITLSLTKKGEEIFTDMHRKHHEILAEQFSILDDEELKKLSSALGILNKVINQNVKEDKK